MSNTIDLKKILLVVANLCKFMRICANCDFLFYEEIKTTKKYILISRYRIPFKFNTFLNVATPLDLPNYRIVDLV